MKCILIGLFLISLAACDSQFEEDAYYPAPEWSDTFDWKLLKAYAMSPNYRNVLISPIGLKLVLALLYEGSGGTTEKEFQNILQFPIDKNEMRKSIEKILVALQPSEREQYILNLGTRMFLDTRVEPQQHFASKAQYSFRTGIEPTNFSQPIQATQTINSWIDKLTNGRVSQMVAPGDLQDAIMILANAIYFKGTWRHQFPKNNTFEGGFYVSLAEIVNVPYMSTTDLFYYGESTELDAKILRLPYQGQNYSLFIVLPNSKGGLPDLIKKINIRTLSVELHNLDKKPVKVCLPKFKFNFQARFTQTLKDFGFQQMFQNTASFPGIARGLPHLLRMLVVSDIVQKTGIELDEEGSVVYSATEIQVGNKFGEVDYGFNATHPFMFFLEEQSTGTILFVGKVENPLETNALSLPTRFGEESQGAQAQVPNLQPANPERDAITWRFNYFDLELLKEYSEHQGNVLISPASIKTTLALIFEGAKGQSATEIGNVLRIDNLDQVEIREILERLLFDLNDRTSSTILDSASAVFVSKNLNIVPNYRKKIKRYYKGTVENIDFTNSNGAAQIINNWVHNATHGFISKLTSGFSSDTSMILANALYFKGKWSTQFNPKSTKDSCFHSLTRGCVNVQMMHLQHTLNYSFNVLLNAHVVELPYQDDKYAMLILVPNSNVKTLARDMQHAQLSLIIDELRPNELILEIPKFTIDFESDIIQPLQELKINTVFTVGADLSGMIQQPNIRVGGILHKARIEVTEEGTTAAAVTSAVVVPLMGSTAIRLTADKPFIFFIYQKESRNVIFEGIYSEPKEVPTSKSLVFPSRYTVPRASYPYQ